MKFFLIALFSLLSAGVFAQETWKVNIGNKTVLSGKFGEEKVPAVTLRKADLAKKRTAVLQFIESNPKKEWDRIVGVADTDEELLMEKTSTRVTVTNTQLANLFKKSKTLKVYAWSLPTDPDLRSRIRIRRILLCTLTLQ